MGEPIAKPIEPKGERMRRVNSWISSIAGLVAGLGLGFAAQPAAANLINPTVVNDTATLWGGFVDDTTTDGGTVQFTVLFPSTNWTVTVEKLDRTGRSGEAADDFTIDVTHTLPSLAEVTHFTAMADDWPLGVFNELPFPLLAWHTLSTPVFGTDEYDALQVRYDPFGVAPTTGQPINRLSIRVEHLAGFSDPTPLDGPLTAIPVPATGLLLGFGLAGLMIARRRQRG